jgi:hypothetical protein
MTRDEHLRAQWLEVRHLDGFPGRSHHAAWYVVRCCPCHPLHPVTLPLPDEARAERVRRIILGEITTPSEPRLRWDREVS